MKQNNSLLHENAKLTRDLAKKKAETEQLHGDIHSYELIKADLERTLLKRAEEFK
jgi:streptomycin 6-kinase